MSLNSHKSVISFPKQHQDLELGRHDDGNSYLEYLLELADRLFHGGSERDDERTA